MIGLDASAPAAIRALRADGVEVFLDEDDGSELLGRARAVVKSPGVPAEARVIAGAHERGLPVLGELELAWRLLESDFIAIIKMKLHPSLAQRRGRSRYAGVKSDHRLPARAQRQCRGRA